MVDVMTPTGRFTPRVDPDQARHYCAIAAGSGITPVLSIVATVLEVEPGSTVTLVYGNRTAALGDVPRGAGRPEGPLPRPVPADPRAVPRAAGRRAAQRPARPGPAAPAARGRCCRRTASTSGSSAGRSRWSRVRARCCSMPASRPRTSTPSCSTSRGRRRASRRRPSRCGRAGTSTVVVTLDGRATTLAGAAHRAADPRCRRSRSAPTRRTPARAGCAAPAGRSWCRARSRWPATTRWTPEEVEAGFVLACQSRAGVGGCRARLRRLTVRGRRTPWPCAGCVLRRRC